MRRIFSATAVVLALAANPAMTAPAHAQAEAHAVFGADLSAEEREEVAALLGVDPEAEAAVLSSQQLDGAVQGTGLPLPAEARSLVSAAARCLPAGSGIAVRTYSTGAMPAAIVALTLVAGGFSDTAVRVSAPSNSGEGGELGVVAAVVAASACRPDTSQDAERIATAYDLAARTLALAGQRADSTAVAAALYEVLAATAVGDGSEESAAVALDAALSALGLPLDPVTAAGFAQLLSRMTAPGTGSALSGRVLHAPSSSEARIEEPAPVAVVAPLPVAESDSLPADVEMVGGAPDEGLVSSERARPAEERSLWQWLAAALLLLGAVAGGVWHRRRRRLNSFVLVYNQHQRFEDAPPGGRRQGGVP